LREALESDRIDLGRAMALAPLARPDSIAALGDLLPSATQMPREDLVARVSELASSARSRRQRRPGRTLKRSATLTERRLLEAYRLLMIVDSVTDGRERELLQQIAARVADLES
jgi:hypothetical protein